MNGVEFVEFCRELMDVKIPLRMDIMNRLCNGYNEFGVGWKNRCLIVNRNEAQDPRLKDFLSKVL